MSIKQTVMTFGSPIINPITKSVLKKHYHADRQLSEPGSYERVVVFAPHMDDETIGAGGTIRRHIEAGAEVYCIFSTDGSNSESSLPKEELSQMRKQEMERVNEILGMKAIYYMDLPDGRVQSTEEAQHKLVKLLEDINPDLIYCTPYVDAHPDHTGTTAILSDALKIWKKNELTLRLYEINCPIPPDEINCVIDISSTFDTKKRAIDIFASQTIAFDGFLELNRLKTGLVKEKAKAVEVFIEVTPEDFILQFDKLRKESYPYHQMFKQANRTVTLLWAIYKNHRQKKRIYKERF
ncbi:PIG-L family deacetylase [Halobacillus salinarum]|uniref:PIG-L family deacetylase n=1 Tax=Halobacillus salinarum TaxID=2932257 RepID=A0ABY4EML7_9BACI|nr:PIG-L deacetylase family protein [Halobacillus salinarum]UOQ45700.1 PIG-L family deacetylase [Halobacillus salinarum]